jgi:hypothetical protein
LVPNWSRCFLDKVRDGTGSDPDARGFDEGITDKRLLITATEFSSVLAVIERQGSTLAGVIRDAWDGKTLRTMTTSPRTATGPHIVIIGHVTPRELKLKLSDAQVFGGTMNRFLPVASKRSKLRPDGGNLPADVLNTYGPKLATVIEKGRNLGPIERTETATELWNANYARLSASRPDGIVASVLARSVPEVLRLSLAYALADGHPVIDEQHLTAALALWAYVEDTTRWLFDQAPGSDELDPLVAYISLAGDQGRTRTEITSDHFNRNKDPAAINELLVSRQERLCGPTGVGLTRSSAQPRTADTMPQ